MNYYFVSFTDDRRGQAIQTPHPMGVGDIVYRDGNQYRIVEDRNGDLIAELIRPRT